MPVYEYECMSCGKEFEEFQKIQDKPLKKCRFCQGKVRRLISQSSFALKGGGWYKDGYSTPPPPKQSTKKPQEKESTKANKDTQTTKKTPSPKAKQAKAS